jgi:hypothetical protein
MNGPRDPEEIIGAWLDESPGRLPETTRRAIAISIRTMRQRRRPLDAPWRPESMTPTKLALLVAALVVAIGGATLLLNRGPNNSDVGNDRPSPTVAPRPSPTPSPVPTRVDTTGWQGFTSVRHGFSASYPADWIAAAASEPWNLEVNQDTATDHPNIDLLSSVMPVWLFAAYGTRLPTGMTYDDFVAAYRGPIVATMLPDCFPPRSEWDPITIDGHGAGLYGGPECEFVEAQVFYQGRVWIFSGAGPLYQDRALFDALLATVKLHPEAADDTPVAGQPTPTGPPLPSP